MVQWDSAADWDTPTAESFVSHPGGDLTNGTVSDDFADADYTANPSWTPFGSGSKTATAGDVDLHLTTDNDWCALRLDGTDATPILTPTTNFVWYGSVKRPSDVTYATGGLVFRATNADNYQYIRTDAGGDLLHFGKFVNGSKSEFSAVSPTRGCANQWAEWKLVAVGSIFQLYTRAPGGSWPASPDVDIHSPDFPTGWCGIGVGLGQTTSPRRMHFTDQKFVPFGRYFSDAKVL